MRFKSIEVIKINKTNWHENKLKLYRKNDKNHNTLTKIKMKKIVQNKLDKKEMSIFQDTVF